MKIHKIGCKVSRELCDAFCLKYKTCAKGHRSLRRHDEIIHIIGSVKSRIDELYCSLVSRRWSWLVDHHKTILRTDKQTSRAAYALFDIFASSRKFIGAVLLATFYYKNYTLILQKLMTLSIVLCIRVCDFLV